MTKMRFLFLLFTLALLLILAKLFYLQIIVPSEFVANYISTEKIKPERGKIYDRNREPLAINQLTNLLYVEPKKMRDKQSLVTELDKILHLGEATLSARIKTDKEWVAVARGITDEEKEKILALKLPEIGFQTEQRRFYPEASLSAHLLGFVGKNIVGDDIGYFGIEGYYDKDLTGLPGVFKSERDLIGRPIFFGTQDFLAAENGRDLILTVDKIIQHLVKNKLKKGIERYQAKEGCIIVAEPTTMAILALSCLPDFDPQKYASYDNNEIFRNWAIGKIYEPGSTFKPLIMAAALEEKVVRPTDLFEEKGAIEVGEQIIHNWNKKYDGKITITRILEKSSNVGMVYIGQKLGNDKLFSYLEKLQLNRITGIDLQGESAGYVKPKDQWYPLDYAAATFGQGIAITPIQLVRSFAAVINGGYLLEPYVVAEIANDKTVKTRERKVVARIFSQNTSEKMKKMLASVVRHAEAKWDIPSNYTIGGKTGTAQIAVGGNYDPTKTIASFVGFAPVDKPRFLVLVVLREPTSSSWGSETAAPLFFELARDLFVYLNITPQ